MGACSCAREDFTKDSNSTFLYIICDRNIFKLISQALSHRQRRFRPCLEDPASQSHDSIKYCRLKRNLRSKRNVQGQNLHKEISTEHNQ